MCLYRTKVQQRFWSLKAAKFDVVSDALAARIQTHGMAYEGLIFALLQEHVLGRIVAFIGQNLDEHVLHTGNTDIHYNRLGILED